MDNNRFSGLPLDDEGNVIKIQKPPPISVHMVSITDLKKTITKVTNMKNEVYYKILHDTVQVITQSEEDFTTVKK